MYLPPLWATLLVTISLQPRENAHQWRVNDFWCYITDTESAVHSHESIINESAASMRKNDHGNIATTYDE